MSSRATGQSGVRQTAGHHPAARVQGGGTEAVSAGRDMKGSVGEATNRVLSSVSPAGEVASVVFDALDLGVHPKAIVAEFGIEPQAVEGLFKKWRRLKQLELLAPSIPDAIEGLRTTVERLVEAHAHARREVSILRARVEAKIEDPVRQVKASARSEEHPRQADSRPEWVCPCGHPNTLAATLECSSCGRRSRWGWRVDGEVR